MKNNDKNFLYISFSLHGQDTSLYLVAVHEIGHALGLSHDNNRASIMFKNYPPASRSKGLPSLDIASIQNMYGSKRRSTTRGKKAKAYNLHSTLMF